MIYSTGTGAYEGWILDEGEYNGEFPAKCESIMCQGNGYMCIRAAMEETGYAHSRYTLVAGTFNLITPDDECTRLPNSADTTEITIKINGETVSPAQMLPGSWKRTLNLKTGLLTRSYIWQSASGKSYTIVYERCVSLKELHLAKFRITVIPAENEKAEYEFVSGIDGDSIPFNGHFINSSVNVSDTHVLQLSCVTCESGIAFATSAHNKLNTEAKRCVEFAGEKTVKETLTASAEGTVVFEKTVTVFTSRDKSRDGCDRSKVASDALEYTNKALQRSFDDVLSESAAEWEKRIWSERDIVIDTDSASDILSIRFAIYHLTAMAPVHDNRMNIGAKGLSGPGYYGHAFWDTEIFMLPYFIYSAPMEARSLIEYRANSLPAARENARRTGWEGARFPWEASWITDGETVPKWCETGDIEIHITSDVAFGAYYYYTVTGDEDFMRRYGYELIMDCAKFWCSRLEWKEAEKRYEITDVMGPNEYKANIDNNAYTNYMAQFVINLAVGYAEKLQSADPELYARLDETLDLQKNLPLWRERAPKIYLPRENENGIIPENDTFLSLTDFTNGRRLSDMMDEARELSLKYTYPMSMICKQADVVALLFLLEDLFTPDIKVKNFYFYEAHCFHDSSLSLSTFSCLASDLHENDMAYHLYERASLIDMGNDMKSSDAGIHAASLGGIWQCCVFGFGGVRLYGDMLRIQPNLPEKWNSITFCIRWRGVKLRISADKSGFSVENLTDDSAVSFLNNGKTVEFTGKIRIDY